MTRTRRARDVGLSLERLGCQWLPGNPRLLGEISVVGAAALRIREAPYASAIF